MMKKVLIFSAIGFLIFHYRKIIMEKVSEFKSPFTGKTSIRIYKEAVAQGMPGLLAAYIVGQSKHETGNYKSKFATVYNSYFGYSYDRNSRWQSAPGTKADNGAKIAGYASLEDSVREVCDWIKRRQKSGKFPKDLNEIKSSLRYATLLYDNKYFMGWKNLTPDQNIKAYAKGIDAGMKAFNV